MFYPAFNRICRSSVLNNKKSTLNLSPPPPPSPCPNIITLAHCNLARYLHLCRKLYLISNTKHKPNTVFCTFANHIIRRNYE